MRTLAALRAAHAAAVTDMTSDPSAVIVNGSATPAALPAAPARQPHARANDSTNPMPPSAIVRGATWVEDDLALEAPRLFEASAEAPSGQYDLEFGRPYNRALRHLTGEDYELRELRLLERTQLLRRAHQAWERNPWAKGAIRIMRAFVVKTGHTVTYRAAAVRDVLERFRLDPLNDVEAADKELCEQLLLDGELFLRLHEGQSVRATGLPPPLMVPDRPLTPDQDGSPPSTAGAGAGAAASQPALPDISSSARLVFESVPPWWVRDILTEPGFRKDVRAYVVEEYRGDSYERGSTQQAVVQVPAAEMVHVAINKLDYELRGRSELFAILPWLKAYKDWLEDRVRLNRLKGALLYDVTIKDQSAAVIAAKRAQYRTPPPPNSVIIHTDREEWKPIDPKIGANDAGADGRTIKLAVHAGLNLPEHFTGDGAEANLATAKAQLLPALTIFEDFQDVLAERVWKALYQRVIALAVREGILNEWEPAINADGEPLLDSQGRPVLVNVYQAYSVAYPPPQEGDPYTLAQALSLLLDKEIISRQTAQEEAGYDPEREDRRILAELERRAELRARGLKQAPPGMADAPASDSARAGGDAETNDGATDDQDDQDDQPAPGAGAPPRTTPTT